MRSHVFTALFAVLLLTLGGCSATRLMPRSQDVSTGGVNWKNYGDAKKFYDSVETGKTRMSEMSKIGLDVKTSKNVRFLSHMTLSQMLSQHRAVLPPAAEECLNSGERCSGLQVEVNVSKEDGTGSLALRLLKFKEESIVRGWEAHMLFLVLDDVVVYKAGIDGTPNGTERKRKHVRPLGPFEGVRIPGLSGIGK